MVLDNHDFLNFSLLSEEGFGNNIVVSRSNTTMSLTSFQALQFMNNCLDLLPNSPILGSNVLYRKDPFKILVFVLENDCQEHYLCCFSRLSGGMEYFVDIENVTYISSLMGGGINAHRDGHNGNFVFRH